MLGVRAEISEGKHFSLKISNHLKMKNIIILFVLSVIIGCSGEGIVEKQALRLYQQPKHMMGLASLDGDPDSVQIIGDYSSDTASFVFRCPANDYISIAGVIVGISDAAIDSTDEYGSTPALTNGIEIFVRDADSTILDTLTPFAIKTNGDWAIACHDVTFHNLSNGNDFVSINWLFNQSGQPINLRAGQFIEVRIMDEDLSSLEKHQYVFHGHYLDEFY